MTFLELKTQVSALLEAKREVSLPSNAVLLVLANDAVLQIANRYKVIRLMTQNINSQILRDLGDGYYMRIPQKLTLNDDVIDLDDELTSAVSFRVSAGLASELKNVASFTKSEQRILKDYSFKLYDTSKLYSTAQ